MTFNQLLSNTDGHQLNLLYSHTSRRSFTEIIVDGSNSTEGVYTTPTKI
jgi:hypothetical protein